VSRAEAIRVEEAHASREKGESPLPRTDYRLFRYWTRSLLVLAKLHEHLLAPLGVRAQPATPTQAIGSYRAARRRREHRLNCQVPRAAEQAVSPALR